MTQGTHLEALRICGNLFIEFGIGCRTNAEKRMIAPSCKQDEFRRGDKAIVGGERSNPWCLERSASVSAEGKVAELLVHLHSSAAQILLLCD